MKPANYAFIDSQNLSLGLKAQGWQIDYKKFRQYLLEEHNAVRAYMFFGFMEGNQDLYMNLQDAGFILVFKPTITRGEGETKGNCDAELVLQAMIEIENYDGGIVVTGDGDFACLVRHWDKVGKFAGAIIPNQIMYSKLLHKINNEQKSNKFTFMNGLRDQLQYHKTGNRGKNVAAKAKSTATAKPGSSAVAAASTPAKAPARSAAKPTTARTSTATRAPRATAAAKTTTPRKPAATRRTATTRTRTAASPKATPTKPVTSSRSTKNPTQTKPSANQGPKKRWSTRDDIEKRLLNSLEI